MYNHQLDTFIRTAELGSFGKASEALYISSTAVIQQINLLENLCGFRLFVRTNHGVKLTPAGKSLYEDAKTLIRFSEDALQKARLLAESSESTLRIGTSLLYKCRMLPDLWPKVNEIQPDLKIEIRPVKEYEDRTTVFSRLGLDLFVRGHLCQRLERFLPFSGAAATATMLRGVPEPSACKGFRALYAGSQRRGAGDAGAGGV